MKKKNKGIKFEIFALFVALFSLLFNILLLYNISKNISSSTEPTAYNHNKKELGEYFKYYQTTNNLAVSDNIVLWEVDKITYRGFFKDSNKKLYYITEKYSCVSGNECVTASDVKQDSEYDYNTTFVVSIDYKDPYDLKFEILDYSIEDSSSFVKEENYDLE